MSVLVDTPVWSYAYRRKRLAPRELLVVEELGSLIVRHQAWLIGPVRQEVLSGFAEPRQFVELRAVLRAFTDVETTTSDYELAAELHNRCRHKGIQGSSTDFLLCAAAIRREAAVFTTDRDFTRYAKHTGVQLHMLSTT